MRQTTGVRDGHYCVSTAQSRSRMTKSSAGGFVHKQQQQQHTSGEDDSSAKQYVDKMSQCRSNVTAKLTSDRDSNGLSAYCRTAATVNDGGDSLESNVVEKPCRMTRSSDTNQQLKVFVDNFSAVSYTHLTLPTKRIV